MSGGSARAALAAVGLAATTLAGVGCQRGSGQPPSHLQASRSGDALVDMAGLLVDLPGLSDSSADVIQADGDGGSCGALSSEGCCDGETLWWCDDGIPKSESCEGKPKCGWNPAGFYDCNTSGVADPDGTHPWICRGILGDGGATPTDQGGDGAQTPCGAILAEGCCDGARLKYCDEGVLRVLDCGFNPSCGWFVQGGYYDCGTTGGSDPKGDFPRLCPGATPVDAAGGDAPPDTGGGIDGGDGGQEGNGCACGLSTTGGPGEWPKGLLLAMAALLAARIPLARRRRARHRRPVARCPPPA